MNLKQLEDFAETVDKYGLALCGILYPSQMDQLRKELEYFRKYHQIRNIEDSFTRLAFMMIVSDLLWQERQGKGEQG